MESNKSLEDYVIADIPRLAHEWNGNIVGGIMVELGHLHPAQVNANGYVGGSGNFLMLQALEMSIVEHFKSLKG